MKQKTMGLLSAQEGHPASRRAEVLVSKHLTHGRSSPNKALQGENCWQKRNPKDNQVHLRRWAQFNTLDMPCVRGGGPEMWLETSVRFLSWRSLEAIRGPGPDPSASRWGCSAEEGRLHRCVCRNSTGTTLWRMGGVGAGMEEVAILKAKMQWWEMEERMEKTDFILEKNLPFLDEVFYENHQQNYLHWICLPLLCPLLV